MKARDQSEIQEKLITLKQLRADLMKIDYQSEKLDSMIDALEWTQESDLLLLIELDLRARI